MESARRKKRLQVLAIIAFFIILGGVGTALGLLLPAVREEKIEDQGRFTEDREPVTG